MNLCDYGCGRPAVHYFKTVDKWCCEKIVLQCPKVKSDSNDNKKGKPTWNKGGTRSKEWTEKIVAKLKGQKRTKEQKEKMKIARNKPGRKTRLGTPHSPETIEKIKRNTPSPKGRRWSEESKKKASKTKKGVKQGPMSKETKLKISIGNTGKIVSAETRRKLRHTKLNIAKRRLKEGHQLMPNYNPTGCKLIDEYGKQHGYNFKHAENGGEFFIEYLAYWVDGYDEQKNIVIEIDEPHHFDSDGNLSEKDIIRQREITERLGCEFLRIKVDKNNKIIN